MYSAVLILHSWLRWLVLLAALFAIVRALSGMRAGRAWDAAADRSLLLFTIALDVQFLLGLILYAISPFTQAAMQDMASAMRNADKI